MDCLSITTNYSIQSEPKTFDIRQENFGIFLFVLGVSSVTVDPSEVNSQLEKLLELDQKRGEMWKETQRLSSSSPLPTTTMINSST